MKELKEFKYQHQLDATNQDQKPRSRVELICGMLLGVLAVGFIWPAATKWVAKESRVAHAMPAKKLVMPSDMPKPIEITRASPEEKITPPPLETERIPPKKAVEVPVSKAMPSQVKTAPKIATKSIAVKKSAKPLEKKMLIAKLDAPLKAAPNKAHRSAEILEETETVLTAQDVQTKTDEVLLKGDVTDSSSGSFVTINNCQYEKSTLANCKAHCLLKAKDANGSPINAIISGPNFADILQEHQGTINLTGKKTLVKGYEVFMVQSITFNLPEQKSTAQAKPSAPAAKKESVSRTPYKGGSEAYEDLGSDLPVR